MMGLSFLSLLLPSSFLVVWFLRRQLAIKLFFRIGPNSGPNATITKLISQLSRCPRWTEPKDSHNCPKPRLHYTSVIYLWKRYFLHVALKKRWFLSEHDLSTLRSIHLHLPG